MPRPAAAHVWQPMNRTADNTLTRLPRTHKLLAEMKKINVVLTHENVTNGNKTRIIICLHWPSDKSFWLGHNFPTKRHRQNTPFSQTAADDM